MKTCPGTRRVVVVSNMGKLGHEGMWGGGGGGVEELLRVSQGRVVRPRPPRQAGLGREKKTPRHQLRVAPGRLLHAPLVVKATRRGWEGKPETQDEFTHSFIHSPNMYSEAV